VAPAARSPAPPFPQTDVDRRQVEILGQTLEGALAAHGVETRLVGATVGPSVTRYELELGPGVKVQRSPPCKETSPTPWPRPTSG